MFAEVEVWAFGLLSLFGRDAPSSRGGYACQWVRQRVEQGRNEQRTEIREKTGD